MTKLIFMSLTLGFLVGCATIYPDVSHTLPEDSVPLPVEVNIDCFKTFRNRLSRCSEDYSKELIQKIQARKLFSEVVSGENQFLDKRQTAVRIDVEEVERPFPQKRSLIIRWRAWNSMGNLLDKKETFDYRVWGAVDIARILDWHMKVAEDSYVELEKKR